MTSIQQIKTVLENAGLPFKSIDCYGSQIVVTSYSMDAAEKWADLLGKFATVRGITQSFDDAVKNKSSCLNPTKIKVHRTFARL